MTDPSSLVWVQHGPIGTPLYCFHPFGGSAAVYGQLAIHIGRDQPVRGLQAVGLLPGQEPDRTVPDMARRYAEEIQLDLSHLPPAAREPMDPPTRQPVFVGYSMGGVLAVETARQLVTRLPEPPVVMVVDCDPVYHSSNGTGPWRILVEQVLAVDLQMTDLIGRPVREGLALVRAAAAEQGRIPLRFPLDRLHAMLRVCEANERAAARHVPAHFPGNLHVLRPAVSMPMTGADQWSAFADRVEVAAVPGDHHNLLGPVGYPFVAARIRALLGTSSRR